MLTAVCIELDTPSGLKGTPSGLEPAQPGTYHAGAAHDLVAATNVRAQDVTPCRTSRQKNMLPLTHLHRDMHLTCQQFCCYGMGVMLCRTVEAQRTSNPGTVY